MSQFDNRGPPSKRGRMDGYKGPPNAGGVRMLSEQEIDNELSKVNPEIRPNKVILLTVLNAEYPIDVPVVSKVCAPIGGVQKIVIFRRGQIIHAMVEFDCIEQASKAKRNLHGCDIYSGCCTLKVEFSKVESLDVKKNDDLTWDFVNEPNLGERKPRMERPVLINDGPDTMGGSYDGPAMRGGQMGMSSMGRGGMGGPGPSRMGNNDAFGGPFNSMSSMMGAINSGMGMGMDDFGPQGGMMGGRFGQGGPKGAVCILYGLDADHFNCQRVFNLFCQYGNIRKIMFLKSKEGTAMMEMDDPGQVESILENMMHAEMFGLKVRADWSKKDCITNVINPYKLKDGSESYQSFEGDRNNRFSTPERAAKNRILPPSKYLHFYNVPKLTDSEMENVFSDAGAPTPTSIKWLNHAESKFVSGILAFDSVGEACEALCLLNHHGFKGDSKYPQVMKLCFSMGPRDRERLRMARWRRNCKKRCHDSNS